MDLRLREIYVNLKNYDFDIHRNYKMEENEAKKLLNALRELEGESNSERDWIPRNNPPEEDGFYLATLDGGLVGEDEPFVSTAEFKNGAWEDDDEGYECTLAWMPFPQPYKNVEV